MSFLAPPWLLRPWCVFEGVARGVDDAGGAVGGVADNIDVGRLLGGDGIQKLDSHLEPSLVFVFGAYQLELVDIAVAYRHTHHDIAAVAFGAAGIGTVGHVKRAALASTLGCIDLRLDLGIRAVDRGSPIAKGDDAGHHGRKAASLCYEVLDRGMAVHKCPSRSSGK